MATCSKIGQAPIACNFIVVVIHGKCRQIACQTHTKHELTAGVTCRESWSVSFWLCQRCTLELAHTLEYASGAVLTLQSH